MHVSRLVILVALLGFGAEGVSRAEGLAGYPSHFFSQSRYGYCDAKLIASLWGTSVSEAKGTIGHKLASGGEAVLQQGLAEARKKALAQFDSHRDLRCTYEELGYSFQDAVVLARVWGEDSWDAKLFIERKYLVTGSTQFIKDALRLAQTASQDPTEAFFTSSYGYCDAAALAKLWGQDVSEAKAAIGRKILSGSAASLGSLISTARAHAAQSGGVPYCAY